MHSFARPIAALLWGTLVATSLAAQGQAKPIDPGNLDTTCAPCKNFFQYANGGWLKRSSIPGDQPRWGSFNELQEQNYAALQDVLSDAAKNASSTNDPNIRKLGTFYGTCMDSAAVEAAGIKPLLPVLAQINAIHDRRGVQVAIARLHRMGIPAGFVFRSVPDAKKSARTIAEVYQGGLGLPDRDYYLKQDSASEKIRGEYVGHVAKMLQLSGLDKAKAERFLEGLTKGKSLGDVQSVEIRIVAAVDAGQVGGEELLELDMTPGRLELTRPSVDGERLEGLLLPGAREPAVGHVQVQDAFVEPRALSEPDRILGAAFLQLRAR